jgi:hypothetical protein
MLFNGSDPWLVLVRTTFWGALVVPYRAVKVRDGVTETPSRRLLARSGVQKRSTAHRRAMSEKQTLLE